MKCYLICYVNEWLLMFCLYIHVQIQVCVCVRVRVYLLMHQRISVVWQSDSGLRFSSQWIMSHQFTFQLLLHCRPPPKVAIFKPALHQHCKSYLLVFAQSLSNFFLSIFLYHVPFSFFNVSATLRIRSSYIKACFYSNGSLWKWGNFSVHAFTFLTACTYMQPITRASIRVGTSLSFIWRLIWAVQ